MKFFKLITSAVMLTGLTIGQTGAHPKSGTAPIEKASNNVVQDTLSWDAKLPFDKAVIAGKLKNGFHYYIRKNKEPEKRVTMYLAVGIGSVVERDNETGLAHFMEHMNFNGTKHFPKNELVNYLQKAGVRFGGDLNASTSFDETIYKLPIPSDDRKLLKNGLQIVRDWAQDALLDAGEINAERGVVLSERRDRLSAEQRMMEKYFPMITNGSRYASRIPIGSKENLESFKPEVLRNFYKRWYRPDLEAIVIVGDIDPKKMEQEVIRLFSDLRVEKNPVKREKYRISLLNKNQFMAVTDPELTNIQGQIYFKHPEEKIKTVRDYRKALLKSIYNRIFSGRLTQLNRSANPPFVEGRIGISDFLGGLDNLTASFDPKTGKIEEGFKAIVRELERADKFGFTQSEFERAVFAVNSSTDAAYAERDKAVSQRFVDAYVDNFLNDSPVLSTDDWYKITKQLLPTLTVSEVVAIGKEYYSSNNRDVLILAPEKDKQTLPDEALVNKWFDEVHNESLKAYDDKVSNLALLAQEPEKGSILSEKTIGPIGAKEIVLSNGVKVILKPTTFKSNEVLFSAFAPGGTSLYSDADFYSANTAASLVSVSGLGQYDATELRKYLTGKQVQVNPFIRERTQGLSGGMNKEGMKTAFEMIYAYFMAPRIDEDAFESWINRAIANVENRDSDPAFVFGKSVLESLYGDNIRRSPSNATKVKTINERRALEIYKERFSDASDFTFTIVGSFTEAEIRPYLEKYLASLPALRKNEKAKDLNIIEPAKGFEKVVHNGKEPRAQVRLAYYGDYDYTEKENMNVAALQTALNTKLLERLREKESGVYGVSVSPSYDKYPTPRYAFQIRFQAEPDKYQSLIASTMDEIRKIKENGPAQVDLDKFKSEQKRQIEVAMKDNGFWLSQIDASYQYQVEPTAFLNYLNTLDGVTVQSVKEVADKYLKEERMFKFILLPEEVKP